jgi:hypothetical protein
MMLRGRPAGLFVLALLASGSLVAATPVLNPRVTRSMQAHGFVPSDCNESIALASMPRVDVAQIPAPQFATLDLVAPPAGDLRSTLRDTQDALRRNDRPTFDARLARAKSLVASYPAGAERRGAEELVRTYEDAASVWDAQFNAPFFDQNAPVYTRLSGYPGWSDAVRRGVLMDDRDRTFYPAAESRTFLTSIAADRLGRLGIRPRETLRPRTETQTTKTPKKTSARPASRRRRSAPVSPDPPARRTPRVAATPAPVAPPPVSKKAAAPPAAGGSSAVVARPVTPAATTTIATATEPTVATTTVSTATEPTVATTTVATATEPAVTTTTVTEAAPEVPQQTRSVILPTILILIGLGVLIVLFRASK